MTSKKYYDLLPELEAKLIDGWHSKKTKRELCAELNVALSSLEAMWTHLRREHKLPMQRRTGFGGRTPGERPPNYNSVRIPTLGVMYAMEMEELRDRKTASTCLLDLLRMHHGCNEAKCGRMDIPPAFLEYEHARRARRAHI